MGRIAREVLLAGSVTGFDLGSTECLAVSTRLGPRFDQIVV